MHPHVEHAPLAAPIPVAREVALPELLDELVGTVVVLHERTRDDQCWHRCLDLLVSTGHQHHQTQNTEEHDHLEVFVSDIMTLPKIKKEVNPEGRKISFFKKRPLNPAIYSQSNRD